MIRQRLRELKVVPLPNDVSPREVRRIMSESVRMPIAGLQSLAAWQMDMFGGITFPDRNNNLDDWQIMITYYQFVTACFQRSVTLLREWPTKRASLLHEFNANNGDIIIALRATDPVWTISHPSKLASWPTLLCDHHCTSGTADTTIVNEMSSTLDFDLNQCTTARERDRHVLYSVRRFGITHRVASLLVKNGDRTPTDTTTDTTNDRRLQTCTSTLSFHRLPDADDIDGQTRFEQLQSLVDNVSFISRRVLPKVADTLRDLIPVSELQMLIVSYLCLSSRDRSNGVKRWRDNNGILMDTWQCISGTDALAPRPYRHSSIAGFFAEGVSPINTIVALASARVFDAITLSVDAPYMFVPALWQLPVQYKHPHSALAAADRSQRRRIEVVVAAPVTLFGDGQLAAPPEFAYFIDVGGTIDYLQMNAVPSDSFRCPFVYVTLDPGSLIGHALLDLLVRCDLVDASWTTGVRAEQTLLPDKKTTSKILNNVIGVDFNWTHQCVNVFCANLTAPRRFMPCGFHAFYDQLYVDSRPQSCHFIPYDSVIGRVVMGDRSQGMLARPVSYLPMMMMGEIGHIQPSKMKKGREQTSFTSQTHHMRHIRIERW